MMKYKLIKFVYLNDEIYNVITSPDEEATTSFPAELDNPNYVQFLEQAKLTDAQVKALKPDTWYDFPKETK